jgi:hypothetical protein
MRESWKQLELLQGLFLVTRRVHGSALHDDRCAACRETNTNFADESTCLTANNVRNEVVTIHILQEVLRMLSSLHVDIFCNCFAKNHRYNNPSCTYSTPDTRMLLDGFSNCVGVLALDFNAPVSWARRFSDFLGVYSNLSLMLKNVLGVHSCKFQSFIPLYKLADLLSETTKEKPTTFKTTAQKLKQYNKTGSCFSINKDLKVMCDI